MNDNHINNEWSDHQQWQPGMPSPDEAWNNMLAKLEEEMPGGMAVKSAGNKNAWRNKLLYALALLLLLVSVVYVKDYINTGIAKSDINNTSSTNTNASKQQQATKPDSTLANTLKEEINHNDVNSKNLLKVFDAGKKKYLLKTAQPTSQKEDTGEDTRFDTKTKDTIATFADDGTVTLNDKAPAIQKRATKKVQPADSSQNNNDEQETQKLIVQAGLQWTALIPVAGAKNYFAGPSAGTQPWRVLLPGVWVSVKRNKDMFMAEVNPFAGSSFNPTSFYSNTSNSEQTSLDTNKLLGKVFGIAGAVSYQHNVKSNWWIGGGLQTNFWKKGVAVLTVKEHDNTTNITTASSESYAISKGDWQHFSKFQLYPHVQVMYNNNKYQAGLRTGATFTALAKDNGPKNLVFTELFFRLPLISNNKK